MIRLQPRGAHIDSNVAVFLELAINLSRAGFQGYMSLRCETPVTNKSCYAPCTIAALLNFCTVRIEYTVKKVCTWIRRWSDSEELIKADTKTAVCQ